MASVSEVAASSTSSIVGVCRRGGGFRCDLKALVHLFHFSGSSTKPRSPSILGGGPMLSVSSEILRRAWSEPRLPSQSMVSSVKVPHWIAALLYQARSIVKSLSCSAPLHIVLLGVLARVRRLNATHSSAWPV